MPNLQLSFIGRRALISINLENKIQNSEYRIQKMNIDLNKLNRILIIRLSSLGDILLTTPLVRSIKKQFPSIEIDILLRKEYCDIYKFNPYLTKLYLYKNQNINSISKELQERHYDLIVDLQNNLRS